MLFPWLPATDRLLREWRAEPRAFNSWEKGIADLVDSGQWRSGVEPMLAPFLNIGEGVLFRDLIREALASCPTRIERLVDFGCGSSLPTISAILGLPETRWPAHVWGVDVDGDAIAASRHNVAAAGLESVYRLEKKDMLSALREHATDLPADLIVANPPYVPAPDGTASGFLTPVDGGTDGLRFLRPILQAPVGSGTLVAIVASSLTSPRLLADLVNESFNVIHCAAHIVPFGPYLKSEPIHSYVKSLREQEVADCFPLSDGREAFITFTLLLKKK